MDDGLTAGVARILHCLGLVGTLALLALVAAAGCRAIGAASGDANASRAAHARDIRARHEERLRRLTAEDGWLSLVGLCWLEEGPNSVGGGENHRVTYEGFPADVGVITRTGRTVTFAPAAGVTVDGVPPDGRIQTDADGAPTILKLGSVRLHVIERGDRLGVRIKDSASSVRLGFRGIERYPVDPAWRIEAAFHPSPPRSFVPVASVLGTVSDEPIAGRATFEVNGHRCDIVLMPGADPDRFFVVVGDTTNGTSTYPGGRFLEAVIGRDAKTVVLDFNLAYNPPCAFTAYATCPLPVPDNRLPFAVEAGEMIDPSDHEDHEE